MRLSTTVPASFALALTLALAAGCGKGEEASHADMAAAASAASMPAAADGQAQGGVRALAQASRALRITIETSIVVGDFDAAVTKVRETIQKSGGYVADARVSGGSGSRSGSFELRVPVDQAEGFRATLAALGEVTSDAQKVEDVTEQRADVGARLSNARVQEKRLVQMLSEKTGNLAEVMAVEKELGSVRETIERTEAQQRVLEGQIAMATVKLTISNRYTPAEMGTIARIGHAGHDGIHAAGAFLVGLVVVTMSAGPTLLLIGALGYAAYLAVRQIVRARRRWTTAHPQG